MTLKPGDVLFIPAGTVHAAKNIGNRKGAELAPYDHLIVALGASTNARLIPGSSNALTFKTMADALVLRNHLIECFERADATADAAERRECLTVVVIGGGLVGVELVGELTAFVEDVLRFYPRIRRDEVCFRLFEAGPRILPEVDAKLAATAARVLERRGVDIQVSTAVRSIDAECVRLESDTIDAGTIGNSPRASSRAPSRAPSLSSATSVAESRWTPRCEAAAIPRCGLSVTVPRFRARTAVLTPRWPSMRFVKHDTSWRTSGRSSTGEPLLRSCSALLAPWRPLGTRARSRESLVCQ